MGDVLHLDYETRSDIDLRKTGLHIYAKGANTDVWCAAWAFNEEPVQLWVPGQPCPSQISRHILSGGEVWAHNAAFEIEITNEVMFRRHGWPQIKPEQTICTMTMAYAMALPAHLEGCAAALGVKEQKDMEGSRLMLQMSKPRDILPNGQIIWWDEPEKLQRLAKYCVQDVYVERAVGARMLKLSPYEKKIWVLDQKINSRGICVDVEAVARALELVEAEKDRLDMDMRRVTNNQVATCNAVQQIKDFLEFYGIGSEALDKPAVLEHLKNDIHPLARQVLELRSEAGKASTAKFQPMLTGAGEDRRLRGCFQYSGANTRRWAGRRIQLQNLKRPSIKFEIIERIIRDLKTRKSAGYISMLYGPPLSILGDCTRSFLTAAPGHELWVCDYNAIEARVIAWLAGQEDVLEVFRKNQDIYQVAASIIFSTPVDKIVDNQRQVGKVAVLALGYGGGVGAFQTMAKGYQVKMAPAFQALMGRASKYHLETVERNFQQNGKRYDIEREEFIASDLTKMFWREANSKIVDYWADIENAAIQAVENPGQTTKAGHPGRQVSYVKNGSFLWCRLPSGGVICYPYPEIKSVKTPWDQTKNALTFMSEDVQSKKWQRFSTYGGSLVENITQATARDLLAEAMLNLETKKYPIVAHVHDEIVCEMPKGLGRIEEMENIMCQIPPWAKDLPIAAKGFISFRYRK